ncbi:MAG: leucine-rich repeat domain-containing protein [Holosporales bacterium]|nr:leucine-rich repeat domain-containing protein [Holosporales bacterium]
MTKKILKIAMLSANYVFCTYCVGTDTRSDYHKGTSTGRGTVSEKGPEVQQTTPCDARVTSLVIPQEQECIPDNMQPRCLWPFLQILTFAPDSKVKSIGRRAFWQCSELSSVQIPQSVEEIKTDAFSCCDKLSHIIFEAGSKLQTIGMEAFYSCKSLASIEIPPRVKTTGMRAFSGCEHLQDIVFAPESQLTTIEAGAFCGCRSLDSIIIPSTVTTIGSWAFCDCSNLTGVIIGNNSSLSEIEEGAFEDCKNIREIKLPSSVQKIGNGAFYGTNIELSIPADSILIPKGCTPQQKKEAMHTFLSYLFVNPEGTYISDGNVILEEISPDSNGSIVKIGNDKWQLTDAATRTWECNQEVISLPIHTQENEIVVANPEKMQILDGNASFTVSLSGLDTIPSLVLWRSFSSSANKVRTVIVPTGVTAIGQEAFRSTDIREVVFGEESRLAEIGEFAFKNCNALSNITLPPSVKSIDKEAFLGCTALQGMTIPSKVNHIGQRVFKDCTALETVTFEAGSKLQKIEEEGFAGCTALRSIIIPSNVECIEWKVFDGCTALETVTFEAGSKLRGIADAAFCNCTALQSITIPSKVTGIGRNVFKDCTELRTVTFEEGCKLIGIAECAFQNCSSLKNIQIPEGVKWIEDGAFDNCTALTNVTLPESLCCGNIFSNCPNLTEVTWNIPQPQHYNRREYFLFSLERMLGLRPNCIVRLKDGTVFLCGDTGWYKSS